jgi:hypothetical protein
MIDRGAIDGNGLSGCVNGIELTFTGIDLSNEKEGYTAVRKVQLYPQKLTLTSPTSGGRSDGI